MGTERGCEPLNPQKPPPLYCVAPAVGSGRPSVEETRRGFRSPLRFHFPCRPPRPSSTVLTVASGRPSRSRTPYAPTRPLYAGPAVGTRRPGPFWRGTGRRMAIALPALRARGVSPTAPGQKAVVGAPAGRWRAARTAFAHATGARYYLRPSTSAGARIFRPVITTRYFPH